MTKKLELFHPDQVVRATIGPKRDQDRDMEEISEVLGADLPATVHLKLMDEHMVDKDFETRADALAWCDGLGLVLLDDPDE